MHNLFAAILMIPVMYSHLHLLEITTTSNQEIQQTRMLLIICTPLTLGLSGMASSVKPGQCCSNGKSPPWFSVELALPKPTIDDIEVHIILRIPQDSIDDIAIQQLELYVQ